MSFLTPMLLAGIALVGLPILLHLVMRRQPEQLVFPALRFVKNRRSSNQTRMRLQHWLLLALRCAAIALLAIGLARPVLRGSGLKGNPSGMLSAALVFDTSPSMAYLRQDQTNLERAQELGRWLATQLPGDSRVAVLDRTPLGRRRAADRDAALLRIDRLQTSGATRPLEQCLREAIEIVSEREGDRQEIYLFTNHAAASFSETTTAAVSELLNAHEEVKLYLVDVGQRASRNWGLSEVRVDPESVVAGSEVRLTAGLYTTTAPESNTGDNPIAVELWLQDASGNVTGNNVSGNVEKRGEQLLQPGTEAEPTAVEFALPSLEEGFYQGFVKLSAGDALTIDNERYFSLRVQPPQPVLIACANDEAAIFVDQALSPAGQELAGGYVTEVIRFSELATTSLDNYRSVLLLDPARLPDASWRALAEYAEQGGGVGLFLGRGITSSEWNRPPVQRLAPGPLKWRSREPTVLAPVNYGAPLLRPLAPYAEAIPWGAFPVYQHWVFEELDPDAVSIVPYRTGTPAIVTQRLGTGRVVTMTTPVSDAANDDAWNLLPTGPEPWPFLALTISTADYLTGVSEVQLNYETGQPARLPLPNNISGYVLRTPQGEPLRQNLAPGQTELLIGATTQAGNYRVEAGGQRGFNGGFSANVPGDAGWLTRREPSELREELGSEQVLVANSQEQLARQVDLGRVGRELYGWLICLVAVVLAGEQWVANRFYRQQLSR